MRLNGRESNAFSVKVGVHQGFVLSFFNSWCSVINQINSIVLWGIIYLTSGNSVTLKTSGRRGLNNLFEYYNFLYLD